MVMETLKFVMVALLGGSTLVARASDMSYEQTVAELKAALKEEPQTKRRQTLETIPMEAGVALAASFVTLGNNGTAPGDAILKGFDLHFGIELFNPKWTAETAFRSFGSERSSANFAVSLTEFDIRLAHRHELDRMTFRSGVGMSARYLRTSDTRRGRNVESTQQTPALILLAGVDKRVSNRFSFGPDLSYRIPLVRETGERASIDGSLRLNMRF